MTESYHFVYMIYAFDKITERLAYSQEIQGIDPEEIKKLFSNPESLYPYIFDSYLVDKKEQFDALKSYIHEDINSDAFDYFIEANTI